MWFPSLWQRYTGGANKYLPFGRHGDQKRETYCIVWSTLRKKKKKGSQHQGEEERRDDQGGGGRKREVPIRGIKNQRGDLRSVANDRRAWKTTWGEGQKMVKVNISSGGRRILTVGVPNPSSSWIGGRGCRKIGTCGDRAGPGSGGNFVWTY